MSEINREQNQWRHGKTPILAKYNAEHAGLMSAIAGRGFSRLPGFAYDAENQLELFAKMGLSELNYNILKETVEREMKQAGIDYDLAYRNALMSWELEKQALMSAWEAEYAGIKKGMSAEEETLDRLMLEVNSRGTYLIEQKTAIELEAEGYRTTLAGLDGQTPPYEVQLANAKLLTAQRKLDIIPILQEIIVKEQELLTKEQEKAAAYADLIAAEQEVADKKESTLVPALGELVNVSEQYTSELAEQVAIEQQIADEKVSQAGIAKANALEQYAQTQVDNSIEDEALALQDQKRILSDTKNANEIAVAQTQIDHTGELGDTETSANAVILDGEESAHSYSLSKKRTAIDTENSTRIQSVDTTSDAENNKIDGVAASHASAMSRKADIDAAASITADLTHLIG